MPVQYNLPPWIKGADTAGAYARGFPLGLQAGEAAARLQHIQAQMQLEAQRIAISNQHQQMALQLAQQREQRESIQKQQELEVLKSYHEEQAHLKQQEIAQAEEKIQQAAAITAHKYQAQAMMMNRAKELISQGIKPEEAFVRASMENPETSGSAMASLARAASAANVPEQNPQVQTARIGDRDVPIIVNPKTGHFQVVPEPKNPLENSKDLTSMINTLNQQPRGKARDAAVANLQNKLNKSLGLPEEEAKAEGPNPLQKGLDYLKSKFGSKTPSENGEVPDWASLPGEETSSLSDIAQRIKAGPAPDESNIPDYAKLPGEDLTGPIPLPNTEKDLSPDETYINPKGGGFLQWNPDTKKLTVIEPPAPEEEPPPETEAGAPLPGEE